MFRWTSSLPVLILTVTLTGCSTVVGSNAEGQAEPLAKEACAFLLDAAKVLVSNDPPSEKADVMERAVDKAVKVAHRASKANPDYAGVLRGAKDTRDAINSGNSEQLASALKNATAECARALRSPS